jgi:hypothetical protein
MRRTPLILLVSLVALAALLPAGAPARGETNLAATHVATVAVVTTRDFRVAVVAQRLDGGGTPTAEVRVAIARKVEGGWREQEELRLRETYFWRTLSGPRSICRLELATAGSPTRPHATVQLLRSPALGCGATHRLALPTR